MKRKEAENCAEADSLASKRSEDKMQSNMSASKNNAANQTPSEMPPWLAQFGDTVASKTAAMLDHRFQALEAKQVEATTNIDVLQKQVAEQAEKHHDLAKVVENLQNNGVRDDNASASGSTHATHGLNASPYAAPHDPSMLLAGGWMPETPKNVMIADLRRVVDTYNQQNQAAFTIEEIQAPGRGQYVTYCFASSETESAVKKARKFANWYKALAEHNKAPCTGADKKFWTVVSQLPEHRALAKKINGGLRALRLIREDRGLGEMENRLGVEVKAIYGRYRGLSIGVYAWGHRVGTYSEVNGNREWSEEKLALTPLKTSIAEVQAHLPRAA
eukprot:TRINITY_DN78783_c0_g1_i1.p1 TRINITY_DN78783_c0_g1~~TRINITY_DN78783_c0_g1_i1.p1  ORF type:complete len:331 (+),score=62.82 TRINITY_DN78783_c0_g1_i1:132-1124(+)